MSQNQQYQKVKLYRVLKVVFYMLGLPLFLVAVSFTTVKFLGHDPFMGGKSFTDSLGFFMQAEQYITAPALYGVWIAFALWAFISIVHIILAKTVKNRRVRMFAVVATCLVVMLLSGIVMDVVFESQISELSATANELYGNGVTVADYKTQLSYYRTLSSNAASKSETYKLIDQIDMLKKVYNVGMIGQDKGGVAGNISNKPVTYGYLISDEDETDGTVKVGVDISFVVDEATGEPKINVDDKNNIAPGDGLITDVERNQVVELKPIDGKLVINGVTYSNYWYKEKGYKTVQYNKDKDKWQTITTKEDPSQVVYVWYSKDLMPTGTVYVGPDGKVLDDNAAGGTVSKVNTTAGVYGEATYNKNGLISDGWVFSLDNVLNILADYYEGKAVLDSKEYAPDVATAIKNAKIDYEDYYQNFASEKEKAYYNQEIVFEDRFSITRGRLDYLIAEVGALLGDNQLFDYLLEKNDEGEYGAIDLINNLPMLNGIKFEGKSIATILRPILTQLENGWSLKSLFGQDDEAFETTAGYIRAAAGLPEDYEIYDAYLVVAYKTEVLGQKKDNLYVALVRDDGFGSIGTNPAKASEGGDVLLDIDFDNTLLGTVGDNDQYAFDLDNLSSFINTALEGLLDKFGVDLYNLLVEGTIGKIGSMLGDKWIVKEFELNGETVKGIPLTISGIQIPLFKIATKRVGGSDKTYFKPIIDISAILVDVLKGLYSYQSPYIKPWWEFIETENNYVGTMVQKYYRAQYEAETYGPMIGSTLIGDKLGTGVFTSDFGLADINAVRQLQVDLSYKPKMYPLFSLRDMLMFFTGLVVFFYFLSFVCAEKEYEYATGNAVAEPRKKRNKKKGKNAIETDAVASDVASIATPETEEDTALPQDENTQKEVE